MDNVLFPTRCRLDAIEASPELPEKVRKEIRAIRNSVNYLQRLTDGLRLFALDPNDQKGMRGVTEIRSWWEQVQPLLARTLPKNAELSWDIAENLPPVSVAPHQLTQAVLNLVVNAGEALDEEQGDGYVKFWAEAFNDQRFVRIGVTDNGCGMTDEVKRHALEPFYTHKTRELSTGLGLSMVHGVAKTSGGSVEIDSTVGEGTTLIMTLPAVARDDETEGRSRDGKESVTAAVTINNPRIAAYATALLDSLGFATITPTSAKPGASVVWIAGLEETTTEMIESYLSDAPGRRVILYGAPARPSRSKKKLNRPEVAYVADLDGLRSAVRKLADLLVGAVE